MTISNSCLRLHLSMTMLAWILYNTDQFTSSWVQAIPNPNLGLVVVGPKFICVLRFWLGILFFDSSHLCPCGSTLESNGDHLLGCGHGPLCIHRHDVVCYILFQALLQDNPQVKCEKQIFGASTACHGNIFYPYFADGCPTYFNISVQSSLLPQFWLPLLLVWPPQLENCPKMPNMITMFPSVGVFSSLLLLSLWVFGLTPVFPSQAALLPIPHSTVGFLVVSFS